MRQLDKQYPEENIEVLKAVYRRLPLIDFGSDLVDRTENLGLIYRDGVEVFCSPAGDEVLEMILGSDNLPKRTVAVESELAEKVFKNRRNL